MNNISENALLFRLRRTYLQCKNEDELYNATRGIWAIGSRRNLADYAFAVFNGTVKKVYRIDCWEPVTPELYKQLGRVEKWEDKFYKRWAFIGKPDEELSAKYENKNIKEYLTGSGTPFNYVNCECMH
jgi:hypothetical protein